MSDLISRQAILKHIEKIRQGVQMMDGDIHRASIIMNGMDLCEEAVRNQPTVDAVPVVRCKECKYARLTYIGECKYCDIWFPDEAVYLDGDEFCSFAERKEE